MPQIPASLSLFIWHSPIAYQNEQHLFLDTMFSLESDKISALWPNDSLTFTFYVKISNSIPKPETFVKEFVLFDAAFRKEGNDCCLTKW